MSVWFQKWWDKGTKQFSIISYRESWSKNGNGMIFKFYTNGAKKSRPTDTCWDVHLIIGYLIFNYTDFSYQSK